MPLPNSGPLSLANIQTEFGGTNPISLNEYYAGGARVPAGTTGTFGPVPSSGAISIRNFYGTTAFIPFGEAVYTTPGTYSYVVPAGITQICAVAVGGGGSVVVQPGTNFRWRKNGAGGGALSYTNNISVTPGETLTVVVGTGGFGATDGGNSSISRGGTVLLLAQGAIRSDGGGTTMTPGGLPGLASNGVGAVRNSGGYGGGYGISANATRSGGGGGAAGYAGNGGDGAFQGSSGTPFSNTSTAGSGGGGGGGGFVFGGGGVGIYGQGANGAAGGGSGSNPGTGGGGGSGGTNGTAPPNNPNNPNSITGGSFGGGAGSQYDDNDEVYGRWGAVRIIWGTGKSYPFNAT